jgi:signal transduction histidine kinase
MLLDRLNNRAATALRLAGLAAIVWSVFAAHHPPAGSGRGLVVAVLLAVVVAAWLAWTVRPRSDHITPDLWVLAAAGGLLTGASPGSGASATVFIAVVAAGIRVELSPAALVVVIAVLALGVAVIVYDQSALGWLAYTLGFTAALLAASGRRQSQVRAEQAELLLAQTQRSHEEQLRAARLQESTRIAREIHDVLAHALAGLTLQLEATGALVEQGADRETVLARVRRAHELAREGLRETRRAVGALRGEAVAAPAGIEALVDEYRTTADSPVNLTIDGDPGRLAGPTGQAVLRVLQEALTNVRKHAPGADVSIAVHAGSGPAEDVVVVVDDQLRHSPPGPAANGLATSGGGYGLQGMRERAQLLGGTLNAGAAAGGWRVELRLPPPEAPAVNGPGRP